MRKRLIFPIVLFLLVGIVNLVSAEVNQVTVEGRVIGKITGNPVGNMEINLWDGDEMKFNIGKTNSDGTFSVTFDMVEVRNADKGDGQSNYYYRLSKDCYISVDVLIQKRGSEWVVSIPQKYENIADAKPIQSNLDFGDVPSNSMISFKLNSDVSVKFAYTWKYIDPELENKYGAGWKTSNYDFVYQNSRDYKQYLSPNSYVRVRLQDKSGNVYPSPIYELGEEVCGELSLTFRNNEFSSNMPIAEGVVEGPFDDGSVLIPVYKGWNLLPFTASDPLDRGSVSKDSFRAFYLYLTPLKDYLNYYINKMRDDAALQKEMERLGIDESWFRSHPYVFMNAGGWFYSTKEGDVAVSMTRDYMGGNFAEMELYSGWNFKTITPDLKGKSYGDIRGDCNIEKVAAWNARSQGWVVNTYNEIESDEFDNFIYEVRIFKVTSDCKLGAGGSSPPPILPN